MPRNNTVHIRAAGVYGESLVQLEEKSLRAGSEMNPPGSSALCLFQHEPPLSKKTKKTHKRYSTGKGEGCNIKKENGRINNEPLRIHMLHRNEVQSFAPRFSHPS